MPSATWRPTRTSGSWSCAGPGPRSAPVPISTGWRRVASCLGRRTSRTRNGWRPPSRPSTHARRRWSRAVHGAAFGGGAGLVACADVAVAAEGTTFAFSEVRLGLMPATISPYVLRAIGPGATRALFTTGRRFDADEALRLGPRARCRHRRTAWTDALAEVVRSLLASGPEAVAACKRLVREARGAGRWPTCPSGSRSPARGRRAARASRPSSSGGARRGPSTPDREPRRDRGPAHPRLPRTGDRDASRPARSGEHGSMAAELADVVAPVDLLPGRVGARRGRRRGRRRRCPSRLRVPVRGCARSRRRSLAAGLAWVGPPPEAMRALGDKERARVLAEQAGVPVVPGATGDDDALRRRRRSSSGSRCS